MNEASTSYARPSGRYQQSRQSIRALPHQRWQQGRTAADDQLQPTGITLLVVLAVVRLLLARLLVVVRLVLVLLVMACSCWYDALTEKIRLADHTRTGVPSR
jgi:hypothetical protein